MNDSGYTSYNLDDSHAADSTDFGSAGNPEKKADSSSTSMCAEEKKGNVRNGRNLFHFSLPGFKFLPCMDCESTGKETISDMVKNRLRDVHRSFKFENMLFMNKNKDYLNPGLPVGVLSTEETYECEFKKGLVFKPNEHSRQYSTEEYSNKWEMGHLYVSKVPYPVSKFSKILQGRTLRVDFFQDESIFEALARDKRFDEDKLRYCTVICDQNQSYLSFGARHYQGKSIEIQRTLKQKDNKLPDAIQPRPHPEASKVKVEPSEIKQEMDSATAGPSTVQPLASSTPEPTTSSKSQMSEENFSHLIECAFEVMSSQKLTTKEKKKLAKQCDLKFTNFALKQDFTTPVSQLEDRVEIAKSVGAIFRMNEAEGPVLIGTGFRIGMQYFITSNHVMNEIEPCPLVSIFLDFNFKKGEVPNPKGCRYGLDSMLPVVRSQDLDYAILRLKEPCDELPPCIFSNISIMDPDNSCWSMLEGQRLTLIGHPQSRPKQMDLMCPVDTTSQVGLQVYGYAVRRLGHSEGDKEYLEFHDKKRGNYHVSNFFHGSSGSPGIVFLNGKKHLVILHTKGYWLGDVNRSFIEQGILFTEIFKHVQECIMKAQQDPVGENVLRDVRLADIFPSVAMDID